MRREILILGIIILIVGIGVAAYYGFVPRTRVYGGYGLAVIGIIIAIAGVMMGPSMPPKTTAGQFACQKCGAEFASQNALDQHNRAKHPMESPNTTTPPPSS
jgi:hypothetical protein